MTLLRHKTYQQSLAYEITLQTKCSIIKKEILKKLNHSENTILLVNIYKDTVSFEILGFVSQKGRFVWKVLP